MSPNQCVRYLKYWSAQVTPQLMLQFSFIEMIWYHRMLFDVELVRWRPKWSEVAENLSLPNSGSATIRKCDPIFFPNINVLLGILFTLPVTSTECERSFSSLERLKMYLRSTRTTERQSGLTCHINSKHGVEVNMTIW